MCRRNEGPAEESGRRAQVLLQEAYGISDAVGLLPRCGPALWDATLTSALFTSGIADETDIVGEFEPREFSARVEMFELLWRSVFFHMTT